MTMLELDYHTVMANGQDEGNRNIRKHGRNQWNINDWNAAAELANKLLDKQEADNDNK